MPTLDQTVDETVTVTRDDEWQYIRVPLSVSLPADELRLRMQRRNGPVTLLAAGLMDAKQNTQSLERFFQKVDEALAAGEVFELEKDLDEPRDVEL